jgi:hypothetical protein
VFQTAEVEHAHATVGTTRHEHVNAAGAEAHIEDFLIMCDQLGFGRQGGNVPDGAGGIDAARDDQLGA